MSQPVSRSMGTCPSLGVIDNSKHSYADLFSIVLRCFCVKYHNYKLYRDPVACANTHRAAGSGRAASHGKSDSIAPRTGILRVVSRVSQTPVRAGQPLVRLLDVGGGKIM